MSNKKIVLLFSCFLVLLILSGCKKPGSVACTQEAKLCPDGSAVSRVAPDCKFAPCPNQPGDQSVDENKNSALNVQGANLNLPINDFYNRITKKPFGIFITPKTSPVQPEKFSGYHTGVDVEYSDTTADIPVFAIADGAVIESRWVSGYGGLLAISHTIADKSYIAIYGHLNLKNAPAKGDNVKAGAKLAILGAGYGSNTDNERQHLHFAILKGETLDLRGYVSSKKELSGWLDPVEFFQIIQN